MNQLKAALEKVGITPIDLAWFERQTGRKYAPLPDCKLRALAKRSGYMSSAEFLAAEHKNHARAER